MTKKNRLTGPIYTVTTSPHIRASDNIEGIMYSVVIALIPSVIMGVYFFGIDGFTRVLLSVISSLFFEHIYCKILKKESQITDGSALITGILIGLNLPSSLPWWAIFAGSFFGIIVVKQFFGGLGYNIFNPALAARVFLLISWPAQMTNFPKPERLLFNIDAVTQATPLTAMKTFLLSHEINGSLSSITDISWLGLFLGNRGGSIGEVSIIALLIGGFYLLYKNVITWHIPVSFIGSAFVFSLILKIIDPALTADPIFHILNGGLIFGAFFMATDYVSSPNTARGMIIFGIFCGFLTILIRQFGGYPEGVSFAILIMNMFVPLIDKFVKPVLFGSARKI